MARINITTDEGVLINTYDEPGDRWTGGIGNLKKRANLADLMSCISMDVERARKQENRNPLTGIKN